MRKCCFAGLALLCPLIGSAQDSVRTDIILGQPPTLSQSISGLPRPESRPLATTGGFSVNINSREQVRDFYNAIFTSSENVAMAATADTAACEPGTNSSAFENAVLLRINWFRAMAGVPSAVTFSPTESAEDQSAALMVSANSQVQHTEIPPTWSCFTTNGTNAAAKSNLALGIDGADAVTSYIWDYGAGNSQAGHRRWILYPQTQVMATGDVPAQGDNSPANAIWIQDTNYEGPRPPGTAPFVAWPPPGYAPDPVVFPQWSFSLSNADLSLASVSMESNGVPLSVTVQPYSYTDYGEDTAVWYPSNLDPTSFASLFPFSGTDTVYSVTVNNVQTVAGLLSFSYNVIVFDPASTGTDYVAAVISGPNQPSVNGSNLYSCASLSNPGLTGYQWLVSQSTNGNLTDNAQNKLANFTVTPSPVYSVITNPPVGSGNCFHLTHTNPAPQWMQLNEVLLPAANTTLSFKSLLGYATSDEIARVQVSTNGGTVWSNLFTDVGSGGSGETSFTAHSYSLSNYAGCLTLLRFDYDYNWASGSYYNQTFNYVGWCIEDIVVTNTSQLVNFVTNTTASPGFNFAPTMAGNYELDACGILYNQFQMDLGPLKAVTATTNVLAIDITLNPPRLTGLQVVIPFAVTQGSAATFNLLQASQLIGPWITNTSAILTTNLAGSLYQFSASANGNSTFYRIRSP
jgi:hypothetical protein